ncbi:hypothetical protein VNO77_18342 [Canavalia gladiata]|uniref:Uncharacterized protein n=1 Tax=Canavalia gladiata TaxID=3824 RepID=A0AAN9LKM1_CANGL
MEKKALAPVKRSLSLSPLFSKLNTALLCHFGPESCNQGTSIAGFSLNFQRGIKENRRESLCLGFLYFAGHHNFLQPSPCARTLFPIRDNGESGLSEQEERVRSRWRVLSRAKRGFDAKVGGGRLLRHGS